MAQRSDTAVTTTPVDPSPVATPSDTDWFLANFDAVLRDYPDQWVAVSNGQVVAHAGSVGDLRRQVKEQRLTRVFIGRSHPDAWASYK